MFDSIYLIQSSIRKSQYGKFKKCLRNEFPLRGVGGASQVRADFGQHIGFHGKDIPLLTQVRTELLDTPRRVGQFSTRNLHVPGFPS